MQHYNASKAVTDYEYENPFVVRSTDHMHAINWDLTSDTDVTHSNETSSTDPWLAKVKDLSPTVFANQLMPVESPEESLAMEWIYGYQGGKSKNNVRYNFQGDLVYHISRYAIVYSFNNHEQRIFSGHTEEILCLDIHPVSES
jgi:hypothetical protein